jgi:poly(3-hydroxybutyrate) depolymerase
MAFKVKYIVLASMILFAMACKKDMAPDETETRYLDPLFAETTVQTVTYSQPFGLTMDIYQPKNDLMQNRPVVVLAFGGGFVNGSSMNPAMVRLGQNLAKRGYVVASINYRIAPGLFNLLDSVAAAEVVIKALNDARAAVRFLRSSAANGNPYNIDPNRIMMGGNSAGAVLAVHVAFLDSADVLPPYMQTIVQSNGGFEGNSGNPGYSSHIRAVFNMAGAIARTGWIDANEPDIISFHGVDDDVVPYECGDVYAGLTGGLDVINLCGSKPIHETALSVGVNSTINPYPGKHVPWMDSATGAPNALFDEIEKKIVEFLFSQL